jgi:hypothetical protein
MKSYRERLKKAGKKPVTITLSQVTREAIDAECIQTGESLSKAIDRLLQERLGIVESVASSRESLREIVTTIVTETVTSIVSEIVHKELDKRLGSGPVTTAKKVRVPVTTKTESYTGDKQAVFDLIIELRDQDMSLTDICNELERRKIPTLRPDGRKWATATVSRIYRRETARRKITGD